MIGCIRWSIVEDHAMLSCCHIIESGRLDPESIMEKDAQLLEQLDPYGMPAIHFYDWSAPCLTYGYFIDPAVHLDLKALDRCGLLRARRPTGGGIIFHLTDFAFSVLIPACHPSLSNNTLENYAFVNQCVAQAIASLGPQNVSPALLPPACCSTAERPSFCLAQPTPYDLVIGRKKVGGAAQRRTKKGLLHQATLSLCQPPYDLLSKVLKDPQVIVSMKENSDCLFSRENELQAQRNLIKDLLSCNLIPQLGQKPERDG